MRPAGPAAVAASRTTRDTRTRRPHRRLREPSGGGDSADEIQRLADLHASGALTDEEFAAAKAKALGL